MSERHIDYTIVVFALILPLFIVAFLLKGFTDQTAFNTALVYTAGYAVAIGGLLFSKFVKEKSPVVWSKDLSKADLGWTVMGFLGMLVVVMFLTAYLTSSTSTQASWLGVLYVPRGAQFATLDPKISDVLYNFALVAPAEELLVVSAAVGFTLQKRLPALSNPYVGLTIARAIWALMHAYLSYQNELLIIPAFVAGLIMSLVMMKTQNVISAIAMHGSWNSIIILMATQVS